MPQGRTDFSSRAGYGNALFSAPERRQRHRETAVAEQWPPEGYDLKRTGAKHATSAHRRLVEDFTEALFDENASRCQEMAARLLDEHGDPQAVVEALLAPAARLIGENWCSDEWNFVHVTVATSRMQRLFRRMTTEYPPAPIADITRTALLGPAPGEQHTFGLSIVEDALARSAWQVDCCDCNEDERLLGLAAANDYVIIGLSLSVERLLPEMASFIKRLRARSRNKSVVLMAGGNLVRQDPNSVKDAGIDLLAVDASSAVALAEAVIAEHCDGAVQSMMAG